MAYVVPLDLSEGSRVQWIYRLELLAALLQLAALLLKWRCS